MKEEGETRILVAFEDEYNAYRSVMAAAIRILRPRDEVEFAGIDALEEQLTRFDPQVVVCSQPNTLDPGGRLAWIQLPLDPTRPAKACVGGRHSELSSPTLEVLLGVIEETEKLVHKEGNWAGC